MYNACISIKERSNVLKKTIAQFDFEFNVYINSLPLGLENHTRNVLNVLNDFLLSKEDKLLFIEDDIIISPRFNNVLNICYKSNYDFITLYSTKTILPKIRNNGFCKIKRSSFFGSQGLVFNRKVAKIILKQWDNRLFFDINIQRISVNNDISIYTYLPNPVDHLDLKSTWSKYGKKHKSYYYA